MSLFVLAVSVAGCLGAAAPGEGHDFTFDQVDVRTFVRLVGEITQLKFVVDDEVKGVVTVVSPRISTDEVYPHALSILESVGCSVVREGDVHRVVSLAGRDSPMAPVVGAGDELPDTGVVTKVFRLEHVSAAEMAQALAPRVGGGKNGAVSAIEETNHLLVTDTAQNIRRIGKLIAEIDRAGSARVTEVMPLQFASAEDLAAQLNRAIQESESRGERLKRRLPGVPGTSQGRGHVSALVVPSPHANSLIVVGSAVRVAEVKDLIAKMDVDTSTGRGRLNAIVLKYTSADEAAKSLNALLTRSAEKPGGAAASGLRRIAIEASAANNALLVDASPADFEVVRRLIEGLDVLPEQVHIEVLIAEVTGSEDLNIGVQMAALPLPSDVGDTVVQGTSVLADDAASLLNVVQSGIFPRGLTVGVAHGTRLDADGNVVVSYPGLINIDALKKDSRFKILSEPSLAAQNNREASVNIVTQIPVLKSTIQGGSGTARDVIQNIERMDVGIKLRLTPRIIPDGKVQMELNPTIEAVIDPGPVGSFTPTIARREVSTTVTVGDGQTIVIAGLTKEDQTTVVKKVPLLGDIPLLGWLFRHTSDVTEQSDLLIFVTPHVATDADDAEEVARRWQEKTGLSRDASE